MMTRGEIETNRPELLETPLPSSPLRLYFGDKAADAFISPPLSKRWTLGSVWQSIRTQNLGSIMRNGI